MLILHSDNNPGQHAPVLLIHTSDEDCTAAVKLYNNQAEPRLKLHHQFIVFTWREHICVQKNPFILLPHPSVASVSDTRSIKCFSNQRIGVGLVSSSRTEHALMNSSSDSTGNMPPADPVPGSQPPPSKQEAAKQASRLVEGLQRQRKSTTG